MKCPSCNHKNLPGADECASCQQDLSSLDGRAQRSRIEKVLMTDPIRKLKPRPCLVVALGSSVLEASRRMNEASVGCALICEQDKLVGVLTEHDIILKVIALGKDPSHIKVETIMTADPETLLEEDQLVFAVNRMAVGGFRHIPIIRSGKLIGIVSVRDVLNYLAQLFS